MDNPCDICGSANLHEIKCKVICRNCGTILQSCADLAVGTHGPGAPGVGAAPPR
jgi:hypothetical protein